MSRWTRTQIYIVLAFVIIYLVWGSTYLFTAFAVEEFSPFFLSAARYSIAAVLVGVWAKARGRLVMPSLRQLGNALLVGVFFLGFGTTGVAWALRTLDTGFAALLISAEPLIILGMLWALHRRTPHWLSFLGIGLGILGIYLLVSQTALVVSHDHGQAVWVIFISMLLWGAGSIYIGRSDMPRQAAVSTALQMLSGSSVSFLIYLIFEPRAPAWAEVSYRGLFSLMYLSILGSALAFTAFNYLLTKVSPEKVATSTYVNPIIALALGWAFHGEFISVQSLVAAIVMLTGVYFVHKARSLSPGFN